jgi:hypothetical protein
VMENKYWEYEVLKFEVSSEGFVVKPDFKEKDFKQTLNTFGAEGWELVSVFDVNMLKGGTKQAIATFKRPLSAEQAASGPPPLP